MRSSIPGSLFCLLLVAPVVHAGMLYKCVGPKDAVTIQSDPCPPGSTEVWKRDSAPAPQPTLQQVVANVVHQGNDAGKTPNAPPVAPGAPAAKSGAPSAPSAPAPPSVVAAPPVASAPTPPAIASPAPPIAPAASSPSTIQLQWHDEPETPTEQPQANSKCDEAKVFANSVREKIWLGLTQDQAQRLYSWVLEQCDQN